MPDNFNSAYLAVRKTKEDTERTRLMAELDSRLASQAPQQSPSPAPTPSPKKESSPGVVAESLKAVGGGILDAGRNAWNAIDDAATWLDNNFMDLRIYSSTFGTVGGRKKTLSGTIDGGHKESLQIPELPAYLQNETVPGKMARSVAQFVVPFLGATKALKAANLMQGTGKAVVAARGATAGAVSDFAAFDPHDARLSNMLLDFTDQNPAVGKPVLDYLAAHPEDTNAEGRLKNTLEGLGVGAVMEGLSATQGRGAMALYCPETGGQESSTEANPRPPTTAWSYGPLSRPSSP